VVLKKNFGEKGLKKGKNLKLPQNGFQALP
jgi:hypothetical protein